jgi:hypothetical protein
MSLPSKAFALAMIAAVPLALSITSPLHATTQFGNVNRATLCDRNPHIDPSLQVCAKERNGITYYRIDMVDGTHAELLVSDSSVELQQTGPDTVRVLIGTPANIIGNDTSSGMTRQVYQDAILSVDEVQDGQHPATWRVYLKTPQVAQPAQNICQSNGCSSQAQQPLKKICDGSGCSGTIQQH